MRRWLTGHEMISLLSLSMPVHVETSLALSITPVAYAAFHPLA